MNLKRKEGRHSKSTKKRRKQQAPTIMDVPYDANENAAPPPPNNPPPPPDANGVDTISPAALLCVQQQQRRRQHLQQQYNERGNNDNDGSDVDRQSSGGSESGGLSMMSSPDHHDGQHLTWSRVSLPLGSVVPPRRSGAASVVVKGKLYMFGVSAVCVVCRFLFPRGGLSRAAVVLPPPPCIASFPLVGESSRNSS